MHYVCFNFGIHGTDISEKENVYDSNDNDDDASDVLLRKVFLLLFKENCERVLLLEVKFAEEL